ncbi:calcium-independent phospholipase A2-gamma-like [Anoplophora glabripennis]|uniref:calcium-independent phospholipase A2-gamma-like n=1 Tax=Anoplophora glabripennis TaxID=217634 RepID=UPI0008737AB3|nr:calcium-independent phospholipase A2-gamma-like [Anoplophora glabripennis]XP_018574390.1 calcium-independent phospholipase A2-gamma-like [Anoplophora glabripennis]
MSFNQWKILNNLKDAVSKITGDKSIQNTFSKDFLQLIQKLPPSLYSNNVIKYFETGSTLNKHKTNTERNEELHLPSVFHGLKNKVVTNDETKTNKAVVLKWKQTTVVSETEILSRIDRVLHILEFAKSEESVLQAIEELIRYLKQYPEIKNKAVKVGAVRLLLFIRRERKNELIQGAIREALAILGYADPVPKKGIRILSIDGGGIRGLLVLEMLKKLEELTGKKVYELFDFFCGVSTGAILSFSIGIHHRSLDEISHGYEKLSKEVFKQSSWRGTGNLVWSHSYYDTALWEKKLKEHLGTFSLIGTARNSSCPKLCAVSAVVNRERVSAFVFRNYALPWKFQSQYLGNSDCEVWQAARASAAAPTYFEEFKLGNLLHQDGGILVNNPTAIALHEVKLIWPNTPIQCVMSFGTGRTVPSPVEFSKQLEKEDNASSSTSWANKFYKILDSATDTEGVHTMLNDLLPGDVYYRFNPYLTEMLSMVETDSQKLEQLRRDAIMYLRRNEDKFQEAARVLMKEKSPVEKVMDYVKVQKEMLGL